MGTNVSKRLGVPKVFWSVCYCLFHSLFLCPLFPLALATVFFFCPPLIPARSSYQAVVRLDFVCQARQNMLPTDNLILAVFNFCFHATGFIYKHSIWTPPNSLPHTTSHPVMSVLTLAPKLSGGHTFPFHLRYTCGNFLMCRHPSAKYATDTPPSPPPWIDVDNRWFLHLGIQWYSVSESAAASISPTNSVRACVCVEYFYLANKLKPHRPNAWHLVERRRYDDVKTTSWRNNHQPEWGLSRTKSTCKCFRMRRLLVLSGI